MAKVSGDVLATYLAAGVSVKELAAAAGVHRRTVYRWLTPAVRRRVAELRQQLADRLAADISKGE